MWFLNAPATNLSINAICSSLDNGYQKTSYQFILQADEPELWVGLAFPWSANKVNGSFKLVSDPLLQQLTNNPKDIIHLTDDNISIWNRLKDLLGKPDTRRAYVRNLLDWHMDDIGLITFKVKPNKYYQITYTHKIAADSRLFLPTRLPVFVNCNIKCQIWTIDALTIDIPNHLKRAEISSTDAELLQTRSNNYAQYTVDEQFEWDDDIRFSTDNWASSDDELCSENSESLVDQ